MNKFYVSTPIYYVNDEPHLGSAYTTLAADIIARYYRLKLGRNNVFFLTGTDEHGQKIAQSAQDKGLSPIKFADSVVPKFKKAWKLLNIDYDYFIRTTDPNHKKVVSEVLQKIYDNGYVHQGVYKGLYCVGCERFLAESDLTNGRCPLHPDKEPVYREEKNYFLKLGDLSKEVLKKIESGVYRVLPEKRKNEVVSRIKQGVEDISISREGVNWGIPIPWDKKQTAYVWIDALWNYYSATRFVKDKSRFWPADLHLIGKDILWFHTVIWQALLIAAGIEIPKIIFAHGFFTRDGQKMSKSLGNVITPKELVERYGVDGARYLIISAVPFGSDGDVSVKLFDEKYNADLANGLGNLVARVAKLCETSQLTFLQSEPRKISTPVVERIEDYRLHDALGIVWAIISGADKTLNQDKPWELKGRTLQVALNKQVQRIRQIAYDLKPFLPQTAEKIERQFKGPKIKSIKPLFPRLK